MLFILRGLPGAGKSTLGAEVADVCFAADDFMPEPFDPKELPKAHSKCRHSVEDALAKGLIVAVANTFTTRREVEPYINIAETRGVKFTVLVVENWHGNKSIHNVPEDTIRKMAKRFYFRGLEH
jgi:predicted kinase